MSELTEERLQEIEARAAKATEGPWDRGSNLCAISSPHRSVAHVEFPLEYGMPRTPDEQAKHDAAFIRNSRQDIPDLVAEVRRLREAQQWRTMDSAPKDGSRFLAETLMVADEYDEYDRLLKKGVRTRGIVVAYYLFGGFVSYPFNGAVPRNVYYTAWQPLPTPQVQS
mgnify:CR=1 FL=1